MRENKVGAGFSKVGQTGVLAAGMKERASTAQLPSPSFKYPSAGPCGLQAGKMRPKRT